MKKHEKMIGGAEISPDGLYRYTLTREWGDGPCVTWLMFNPSTATADEPDATIRKCIGFSRNWGYGKLIVVNLFAISSRDPKSVAKTSDPVGPLNNYWLLEALRQSKEIICAWGCGQHFPKGESRLNHIASIFSDDPEIKATCLGYGKDGNPRHPLMLAYETPRQDFTWKAK